MQIKDKYSSNWNVYQGRKGKIYTSFGDKLVIELTVDQAEQLPILSDPDFDIEAYKQAYGLDEMLEPKITSTYRLQNL